VIQKANHDHRRQTILFSASMHIIAKLILLFNDLDQASRFLKWNLHYLLSWVITRIKCIQNM